MSLRRVRAPSDDLLQPLADGQLESNPSCSSFGVVNAALIGATEAEGGSLDRAIVNISARQVWACESCRPPLLVAILRFELLVYNLSFVLLHGAGWLGVGRVLSERSTIDYVIAASGAKHRHQGMLVHLTQRCFW